MLILTDGHLFFISWTWGSRLFYHKLFLFLILKHYFPILKFFTKR